MTGTLVQTPHRAAKRSLARPRRDRLRQPEYYRAIPRRSAELLDELRISWCAALDTAQTALRAADALLPAGELHERVSRLTRERAQTMNLLELMGATGREPALTRS